MRLVSRIARLGLIGLALASPGAAPARQAGVPVKHAETNSVRAVQFFASQKSKDGLMLAVYGDDPRLQATAVRAAAQAREAGYPLRGVIFGPRRDDAHTAIEFYADAQLTATFLNPASEDAAPVFGEIRRGNAEIVQPRLAAATQE